MKLGVLQLIEFNNNYDRATCVGELCTEFDLLLSTSMKYCECY
jgi:hypothetical protein